MRYMTLKDIPDDCYEYKGVVDKDDNVKIYKMDIEEDLANFEIKELDIAKKLISTILSVWILEDFEHDIPRIHYLLTSMAKHLESLRTKYKAMIKIKHGATIAKDKDLFKVTIKSMSNISKDYFIRHRYTMSFSIIKSGFPELKIINDYKEFSILEGEYYIVK